MKRLKAALLLLATALGFSCNIADRHAQHSITDTNDFAIAVVSETSGGENPNPNPLLDNNMND